ncbi:hypothetical protein Pfo_021068 [Paulownia fortunei]|nr:hypothetical protein Pfo_021068 [Paulownia fortunei]
MASQSYHETSMIFIAAIVASSAVAASQDKVVEYRCNFTSVKYLCEVTLFPDSCQSSIVHIIDSNNTWPNQLLLIYEQSTLAAMAGVSNASPDFSVNGTLEKLVTNKMPNNRLALSALESCRVLLSLALDNINNSLSSSDELLSSHETRDNIRTWLSAAGADLQTCSDGFGDLVYDVRKLVLEKLRNSTEYSSNSLAIITLIDRCLGSTMESNKSGFIGQNLLSHNHDHTPYWLTSNDRKLLLAMNPNLIKPDLVVAQDGSGNHTTINDALKAVPDHSNYRFIIYVKKGVYYENVKVNKSKWNVMMIGDGLVQTIVSGNLNHDDGTKTFLTATFAVFGKGFIAQQMGFRNTATKSQAVALLSTADQSVFFKCLVDSKQDTLYVHSNRQFHRECYIYGTIDFIFGDAAVVIQRSIILPKNPFPGHINVITAQGKTDPNHNTGISIQNCVIKPAEDLTGVRTFLGRPWKNYSTTVFLQNLMDSLIDPHGWLPWNTSAGAPPPPNTIFYAEYNNKGPGAITNDRVKWDGVRVMLSRDEVSKFTVSYLINGDQWLLETGVRFKSGLL